MPRRKTLQKSLNFPSYLLILFLVLAIGIIIIFWSIWRPFCANSRSCEDSLSLNVTSGETGTFSGQKVVPPSIDLNDEANKPVLGQKAADGQKHIYVDLTTQTLEAYEGDTLFLRAPVSTGKWGRTPTGEFSIWQKLKATKMSGGSGNDYYYLPNVPFVMFFANDKVGAGRGFGLHGTYWHNNFGHPMSHGCVNLRTVDAEKLYYWVNPVASGNVTRATEDNPGTKITIYGEAPI
jgi:hypothetical protein